MSGVEKRDRTTREELLRDEAYRRWVARNENAIERAYTDEVDGRLPLTFAFRAWMYAELGKRTPSAHLGEVRRGAELVATAAVSTAKVVYSGTIDALALLHQANGREVKWPRIDRARRFADESLVAIERDRDAEDADRAAARLVAVAVRVHEATLRSAFAPSGESAAHERALKGLIEQFVETAHVALGKGLSTAIEVAFPFWSLPTAAAWRTPAPRGRHTDGAPCLRAGTLTEHWIGLALDMDIEYERIADAVDAAIGRVLAELRPRRGTALARQLAFAERLNRAFRTLDVDDHLDALGLTRTCVPDMAPCALFELNTAMLPHPRPKRGWTDAEWAAADEAFNELVIPVLREYLPEVSAELAVHAEWIARRDQEERERTERLAAEERERAAKLATSGGSPEPDLSVYDLPGALGVIHVDVGASARAVA